VHKNKISSFVNLSCHLKKQTNHRSTLEQQTKRQRNSEKTGMLLCLEVEFLSLSASCVAVSSICAAPFSNMCSTQADISSRKFRLHCGCQFPWCALALRVCSLVINWFTCTQEYYFLRLQSLLVHIFKTEVNRFQLKPTWITDETFVDQIWSPSRKLR
jgi:hypothetical protein